MEYLNKNYSNPHYKKDPYYHVGVQALQYHAPNEVRNLRKMLADEMEKKGPGFVLTDDAVITWTNEIKKEKSPRLLRFLHRVVWWFTAPNSDAWRRWVLYRTIKET